MSIVSQSPDDKYCPQCKTWFPRTPEFWYANKDKKDGYRGWCRHCTNANNRLSYQRNSESIKKAHHNYYQKNRDLFKKLNDKWARENRIKHRAKAHRHRINKKENGGSYTQEELKVQFESQGKRCFHCGKFINLNNGKTCHIDHFIPISKGGSNNIDNIRLLCPSCNLSKGAKLPHEWHSKYL